MYGKADNLNVSTPAACHLPCCVRGEIQKVSDRKGCQIIFRGLCILLMLFYRLLFRARLAVINLCLIPVTIFSRIVMGSAPRSSKKH